jgi:hypothetical protein
MAATIAFAKRRAQHGVSRGKAVMSGMRSTDASARAAQSIERTITGYYGEAPPASLVESIAGTIDCETGLRELVDALEAVLDEAGDLIDERGPELATRARAALRFSGDQIPRTD